MPEGEEAVQKRSKKKDREDRGSVDSSSSSLMRGVYRPTAWGTGRSYAEEIDVDTFGEPSTPEPSAEFGSFPSTSFVAPPPSPRRTGTSILGKKRYKTGAARRPYGSGKFVPLVPGSQFDISSGIQDQANLSGGLVSDGIGDELTVDGGSGGGEVAIQHEGQDVVPGISEEIIGGPGDELLQPPAAEELMEDIQPDNLLKDIISQLEQRTQQPPTGIPQSPMTSLMRTIMQSPTGKNSATRRLSLSDTSLPGSSDLAPMSSSSSMFDLQASDPTTSQVAMAQTPQQPHHPDLPRAE